jgi:hypothetical protein
MEIYLIWWAVCGIIASVIGSIKDRPILGLTFGLLCGPVGVMIILLIKGSRETCTHCKERIHKDALVCPSCRVEILAGYGEVHAGNRGAMRIAAALLIIVVIGAGVWSSLNTFNNTSKANTYKPQARTQVTLKQFYQIRENMLYGDVVRILGFRGERMSEIRLDGTRTLVTYRWVNMNGSMVIVSFRSLPTKIGEDYVMLADSISNMGLIE